MSDTDDTDVLLLIPPKFFTIPSDIEIEDEEKSIVDELRTQVSKLENRVHVIENFASSRCDSEDEFPREKRDKDTVLKEIDGYLESVRKIRLEKEQRLTEAKMENEKVIESRFLNGIPNKKLALNDIHSLVKEIGETQNEIENKLRTREAEYGLDKSPRKSYLLGDNLGSVPDLGFGVREMFSPNISPSKAKDSTNKNPCIEEPCVKRDEFLVGSSGGDRRSSTSSSFTRSPRKDFNKFLPEARRYRTHLSPRRRLQLTPDLRSKDDDKSEPESRYKNKEISEQNIKSNLISLTDLWKSDGSSTADDPSKLRQKLEEEKYRRLHLENTIQSLNRKVLEEQEKLAVAMKVDDEKDKAIGKITEAWKQMVEHWKEIEADRYSMSQKLITEKTLIKKAQEEINKKIDRWEKEVSQALDLAAGFKGKCEYLEAELTVAKETAGVRIKDLEEQLESKETTLKTLLEERSSLLEKLKDSEEDHENEKKLVEIARSEVEIVQKNLSEMEAKFAVTKEQNEQLQERLKAEKLRTQTLEQQKNQLQETFAELKTKQKIAEDEAKSARENMDKAKSELRALYQSQLESVVHDKLAEFQGQLDAAQASMQAEMESNKRIAQQKAEQQRSSLINSHLAEIRRLEAVHKEETKELVLRLAESEKRRMKLENGKKDIAQKLHGVMEKQWQQALSIITSELSVRQLEEKGQGDDRPGSSHRSKTAETNGEERRDSLQPSNQDGLFKYIQMLLDKQPGKPVDSSVWQDTSQSENLDQSMHENFPWHQLIIPSNLRNGIQEPQGSKKPPWK